MFTELYKVTQQPILDLIFKLIDTFSSVFTGHGKKNNANQNYMYIFMYSALYLVLLNTCLTVSYCFICSKHFHHSISVRLVEGSNRRHVGRLEIFHQNTWGTICDDSFTNIAAGIACRSLDPMYIDGEFISSNRPTLPVAPRQVCSRSTELTSELVRCIQGRIQSNHSTQINL